MVDYAKKIVAKFARDEKGASAVEYVILAAVVGAGLVVAAGNLSTGITAAFGRIVTSLTPPVA